jgi:hypothetical protein
MRPDGRQAGARRRTGNKVVHRLPGQRLTALGQEQPGELVRARGKVSFDSAQLVAGDRLLDREAILEPPHPQPGLLEIHFVAPQRHRLADPQPMTIHHKHKQMVAYAVPPGLGSIEQRGDFRLRQKVLGPFVAVGSTSAATFDISPLGRSPRHTANPLLILSSGRPTFNERLLL